MMMMMMVMTTMMFVDRYTSYQSGGLAEVKG